MGKINHKSHYPVKFGKTGVLLVNLGTPDATDYWSIRRYLKEFLSDPRVIEVNRILWWFILNFIILTFRPFKTAKAYKSIWKKDTNESPLLYYTKMQAKKLKMHFDAEKTIVDFAMRYGNPSIESKILSMQKQGCTKFVIMPLYPQYCAATTATICDKVLETLKKIRWQPTVRFADAYHDHPLYIKGLANSVKKHLKTLDWKPDMIIASFHGIPKRYFDSGDPYQCFCHKTARLLREELKLSEDEFKVTFQSRFGREEWIKPYTDETINSLPEQGIKKIAVITPGFASDCVETLEEIDMEVREEFIENGGTHFTMIPCLNDSDDSIQMIKEIVIDTMGNK